MTDALTTCGLKMETLDALRDLVADAAIRPAHNPVPSARACTSPIHLTGESRTINAATGEVLRAFSTADLPGQIVEVACATGEALCARPAPRPTLPTPTSSSPLA